MHNTQDSLDVKIAKWGLYITFVLVLATPLFLVSKFLFPFITPKTLWFRLLVEIGFVFWVYLMVKLPEFRPKFHPIQAAVLLYTLIITLSSLFGVNLYRSFWGTIERGEGLLTIYHVVLFFLMATSVIKQEKWWLRLLDASVLVSVVTGIYAIAQILQFDVIHSGETRISSTIGNAAFYAGYLLINVFLAAYLMTRYRNILLKIFYGAVIIFEIFLIFATQTRGALLALFGGLVLLAIINLFFAPHGKVKKISGAALLALAIFSLALFASKEAAWVKNTGALNRVVTISFDDITTQSRLLTWDSSIQAFKDRPLLGYGYENFNVAFNTYFHAEIFQDAGSQIWFDRAHSIVFEQLVIGGALGLLSYLAIFVIVFRELYRVARRQPDYFYPASVLAVMLVAYFVQNIFVFDTLSTYIGFVLMLGVACVLAYNQPASDASATVTGGRNVRAWLPATTLVSLIVLAATAYYFNIRPAQANLLGVDALRAGHFDEFASGTVIFKNAISYNTYQTSELRQKFAELAFNASGSNKLTDQQKSAIFNDAIFEIKENIKNAPQNVQNYLYLMTLYNAADRFDISRLSQVIKLGEQALLLSPTRPQIYFEMGQAAISLGNLDEGIGYFEKAVELNPEARESHWNLAASLIIAGRNAEADEVFARMEAQGFVFATHDNLRRILQVYMVLDDKAAIVRTYEQILELDETNPETWARLAAAYAELGELEKARDAVTRAVELDPELATEAQAFLEQIRLATTTEE
jgi:O-antigen ligase/tetratricopeptide (TPR) repeat protein